MTKYIDLDNRDGLFLGRREAKSGDTFVTYNGGPLRERLDLWCHSPTGFEWGFNGSGPAQLALAILAQATGSDNAAVKLHQLFKRDVVARLPKLEWRMTEFEVFTWAMANLSEKEWESVGPDLH